MTLKELCETISCRNSEQMPSASSGNDHSPEGGSKIGCGDPMMLRIMTPESYPPVPETKTYPLRQSDPLFALCWVFHGDGYLDAAMEPADPPFSCHLPLYRRNQRSHASETAAHGPDRIRRGPGLHRAAHCRIRHSAVDL